jgi:hypothetical protein
LEHWKRSDFHCWVGENEEAALLYYLVVEVNGAVITAAHHWRELGSVASLLGISMIDRSRESKPVLPEIMRDFSECWRRKLCTLLADVTALHQAIDLISHRYFDGHDVLFADAKEQLTSSHEAVELLVAGYNCFAEDHGKKPIDLEVDAGYPGCSVEQRLNEWVMLSRSRALAVCGRIFEAREEASRYLSLDVPIAD